MDARGAQSNEPCLFPRGFSHSSPDPKVGPKKGVERGRETSMWERMFSDPSSTFIREALSDSPLPHGTSGHSLAPAVHSQSPLYFPFTVSITVATNYLYDWLFGESPPQSVGSS